MITSTTNSKRVKWLEHSGLTVMLVYGLLCCYYFVERTTFLDNPFSIYKLIQEKALHVSANRWPAAVIKILPLLCIKAQLSLKAILFSFSLSYYFFHLILLLVVRYQLKDKVYSWLLVATLILPVAHSFFWNNSELILGLSVLCYWLAQLRAGRYMGSIVTGLVMAWLHPLLLLLVVYSLVLLFIDNKIARKLLFLNGGTYVAMHLIKDIFFPNYYDTNKTALFKRKLSNYNLSDGTLFELISDWHHLVLITFIVLSLGLCIYKRKFMQAILLTGFCLCYLFINDLGSDNTFYVFYHETNFLILFFAAAFTFCVARLWEGLPYYSVVLGLFLLTGLLRIVAAGQFYSERTAWYQEVAVSHDRAIIAYGHSTKDYLIQDWASAFESLIISTVKGKSAAVIFSENSKKLDMELSENRIFITGMGDHFDKDPDPYYFDLDDRSYEKIKID